MTLLPLLMAEREMPLPPLRRRDADDIDYVDDTLC